MKKIAAALLAALLILSFAACSPNTQPDPQQPNGNDPTSQDDNTGKDNSKIDDNNGTDNGLNPNGDNGGKQDPTSPDDGGTSGQLNLPSTETGSVKMRDSKTYQVFSKVAGSNYYLRLKQEIAGQTSTISAGYKDGNMAVDTQSGDLNITIMTKDGATYLIDHASKSYFQSPADPDDDTDDMDLIDEFFDDDDLDELLKTGTIEISGKTYSYEQETDDDSVSKMCFDGDVLKYIVENVAGVTNLIEVIELSDTAPDSLFEIPADYQAATLPQ